MKYKLYKNDLPLSFKFSDTIAVDTETMGLKPHRDRLCMVQISKGDGLAHLIQIDNNTSSNFKNLKKLFQSESILKIFHFARFDLSIIEKNICKVKGPVYCTKIASKISRTFGARHGLKDLCQDLLGIVLEKESQTTDWGDIKLTNKQLEYASNDVIYLHQIKQKLDKLLHREGKLDIAEKCFNFIKTRSHLDLIGYEDIDIFSH